jgi:hypothetical protein
MKKNVQGKDDILCYFYFLEKKGPAWWRAWTSTLWSTISYSIIYSKEAPSGTAKFSMLQAGKHSTNLSKEMLWN